jgi:hypothetical protein
MFMVLKSRSGLAVGLLVTVAAGAVGNAKALDNTIFPQFAQHIIQQVHRDKEAFAKASTCLSWFYKAAKTPPPAVQGINWQPTGLLQPEKDCPHYYPKGMEAARDDFAKTQTLLSVSLTIYEFALVADHNDDHAYNAAELKDLFSSLSLTLNINDPTQSTLTLTDRFDYWYRIRNLEEVMKGMSILYERGYRVTAGDRADLDRVMK